MTSALTAPIFNRGGFTDDPAADDLYEAFGKAEAAFAEIVLTLAAKADAAGLSASQLTDVSAVVRLALQAADLPGFRAALGLGNVANLAPVDLPVSTATQAALTQVNALAASTRALVDSILQGANGAVDTFAEVFQRFLADESVAASITSTLAAEVARAKAAEALLAPLASPVFTGAPRAPTPAAGDSSTALATTEFVARTASLAGAILYNAAQGLAGSAKLTAKKNLSVEIGRRYYTGNSGAVTITAADIGGLVYLEADITSCTFPLAANYTDGDYVRIYCRGTVNVQATAGDPYTFGFASNNVGGFTMRPGDRCKIVMGADAWNVVEYTTRHDKALMADRALTFSDTEKQQLLANADIVVPHGQCRLNYVSETQIRLDQCNGNRIFISGLYRTIPVAGIVLSNTALSTNTLYYIYAYWTGSAVALTYSTNGPSVSATTGQKIYQSDNNTVYVGAVFIDGGGKFKDAPASRFVLTHFNKRYRSLIGAGNTYTTSSQSSVELSTAARVYFICDDAGHSVTANISGQGGSGGTSPGYPVYAGPSLDGADGAPTGMAGNPAYGTATMAATYSWDPGPGLHYITVKGLVIGSYNGQFNGAVSGMVMM